MSGVYREINAPERTVHTERFDDYPGESVVTSTWVEREGRTTLTAIVLAESKEIRDAVIKSGMEHGAAETYDKLAEFWHRNLPTGKEHIGALSISREKIV